jgi:hypothetical protein
MFGPYSSLRMSAQRELGIRAGPAAFVDAFNHVSDSLAFNQVSMLILSHGICGVTNIRLMRGRNWPIGYSVIDHVPLR